MIVGMMSIAMIKLFKYFIIGISGLISLTCFVFTLFFIVSTFAAINQATFPQFIALLGFSGAFAATGNGFMMIAEFLNSKAGIGA